MTRFLHDEFLLTTDLAVELFQAASTEPIIDVHNHLVPADIAQDRTWDTITDLWLEDDHYKWRAMRLAGVDELLITGDADPFDKFMAWAATMPRLLGNPLHTWTHLELKRAFGVDQVLTPESAPAIYAAVNEQLGELSAQRLLDHFDVELVATTDSPPDSLEFHAQHAESSGVAMVPTFRPDGAHSLLDDPVAWNEWIDRLAQLEATSITDLGSLLGALRSSHARFARLGCRASDHGLAWLPDHPRNPAVADDAIRRARDGQRVEEHDADFVMLEVLALVTELAMANDSVMQLHLGPLRNVSPRLLARVGRDAGADVMGDRPQAAGLARFLGEREADNSLPRTILYNLNPADNAVFVAMAGAFARSDVAQLVQWGPPWWFNDHDAGMRSQLDQLAQVGQLAGFVGMLTDSRSILSMTRHELFRRVLCAKVGDAVEAGLYPNDRRYLTEMVQGVCVGNARSFFGMA